MNFHPITTQSVVPPSFGGVTDALAAGVGLLDKNRVAELVTTDVAGMTLPRTAIETTQRGPDAGRETAIREFSAMIGTMFIVGWFSQMFIKLMGNKVNRLNPHGIPGDAWLNSKALNALDKITQDALKTADTFPEFRRQIIRTVLAETRSADRALVARLFQQAAPDLDLKMKNRHLATGYLSQEAEESLRKYFEPERADKFGTANLNQPARDYAKKQVAKKAPPAQDVASLEAAAYRKERLSLSQAAGRKRGREFLALVDEIAQKGGLSDGVVLDGAHLKRETVLSNMKTYLEQVIDRAGEGFESQATGEGGDWKRIVHDRIYKQAEEQGGFLARLKNCCRPSVQDGLIPAIRKSKFFYTRVPIVMAIVFSAMIVFVNNWLTRRKHGGQNFFPGEGLPDAIKNAKKPASPQQGQVAPTAPSLQLRRSVFAPFQQQAQSAQGGRST